MPKSKKKKSTKKGKTKSKGKGKQKLSEGEKLCANMDMKAKMAYLIDLGILQDIDRCEPIEFEEFIGDINYIGSVQDGINSVDIQPKPTLAHARQFSIEFGALPLGSTYLRSKQSSIIRSILLYGPSGSGKSFLSQCIAHSTSSRWIDLSPQLLPGNDKELSKIIHCAFAVAAYLQPCVIFIDQIEKIFIGNKMKKLKKDLITHVNNKIDISKRILVIGNTQCPFDDRIDFGDFCSFFGDGRMCYVPYPNYLNRQRLWTHFIQESGLHIEELNSKSKQFELSSLTLLSEGYTAGSICKSVQCVLSERRFEKYHQFKQAFTTREFIKALAKTEYNYKDNQQLFAVFTAQITGRTKDIKQIKAKQAAEEAGNDGDKKGKDDKKKKAKKKKGN